MKEDEDFCLVLTPKNKNSFHFHFNDHFCISFQIQIPSLLNYIRFDYMACVKNYIKLNGKTRLSPLHSTRGNEFLSFLFFSTKIDQNLYFIFSRSLNSILLYLLK